MGINPHYNGMNRIGLTFLYQQSHVQSGERIDGTGSKVVANPHSKILHGGADVDENGLTIGEREQRKTIELSWRHHISRSISLTLLVPFVENQIESVGTLTVRGLGDLTVMGHYIVDNLFSEQTPSTLLLGSGVTLPTGASNLQNSHGEIIDTRYQPGHGSVGFVGNALLMMPLSDWTFAFDLYGKTNRPNSRDDRTGNSLSLTSTISHDLYRNNPMNFGLVGTAGLRGEVSGQDKVGGERDPSSGSETLWTNVGGQIVFKSFKLEASALVPIAQRRASGGADEDVRLSLGLRYEFR